MKLELLISALNAQPESLIERMKVASDAVLVNQCDVDSKSVINLNEGTVKVFSSKDRGIGVSRNLALSKSSDDFVLFADDDIVYEENYASVILDEFEKHPEADGIFFNLKVDEKRRTYHTDEFGPVTFTSSGRYPTYSLAVKRSRVVDAGISFSTLFGGGAKYSCGEDSLFIRDCLKAGLKLFKSPANIGEEIYRESTWFKGYDEKFFFDRGVLYHFLYGHLATAFGARFILKHRKVMCGTIKPAKAFSLLLKGVREGISIDR